MQAIEFIEKDQIKDAPSAVGRIFYLIFRN